MKILKDEDYSKKIVPLLEELKASIDKTFGTYLDSIISPKLQRRLSHQLWQQVVKQAIPGTAVVITLFGNLLDSELQNCHGQKGRFFYDRNARLL